MVQRYELFTRFTVPSLRGQTCQDFTWLLLVDPRTPAHFKRQLEDVAPANMRIVYPAESQLVFLKREIQGAGKVVITSVIDNDDAWHKDLVATIHRRFTRPTRLIDFAQSYWFDWPNKKLFLNPWRWYYRLNRCVGNNPTMVEHRDRAKTALFDWHSKLKKHVRWYQFKKVTRPCYRLIVCHEQNQVNSLQTGPSELIEMPLEHLKEFNVKLD
jgi:hypothetical protein